MNNRDGGPAYPVENQYNDEGALVWKPSAGMAMRQSYKLAAPLTKKVEAMVDDCEELEIKAAVLATWAGIYADAMLSEDEAHELEGRND